MGCQKHGIISFSFSFSLYGTKGGAAASETSLSDETRPGGLDQATQSTQPTFITVNVEIGNEGVINIKEESASLTTRTVEITPPTEPSATSEVVCEHDNTQEVNNNKSG